jgi:hypothetical protein
LDPGVDTRLEQSDALRLLPSSALGLGFASFGFGACGAS